MGAGSNLLKWFLALMPLVMHSGGEMYTEEEINELSKLTDEWDNSLKENTQKSYSNAFKHFVGFCSRHHLDAKPLDEFTMAKFLQEESPNMGPSLFRQCHSVLNRQWIKEGVMAGDKSRRDLLEINGPYKIAYNTAMQRFQSNAVNRSA